MTEQTKAELLADALDRWHDGEIVEKAAAELRRVSAVEQQRDELLEALAATSVALGTGHNALIALKTARAVIAKAEGKL